MTVYRIVMKHDRGRVTITTAASSQDAAIEQVCNIERAPRRAVQSITNTTTGETTTYTEADHDARLLAELNG